MNELLIPLLLRAMCGPPSLPPGRCLRNGKGMRWFGLFILLVALLIALAAGLQARPLRPSEITAVESMVLGFSLAGLFFLVGPYAVDFSYDDAGITRRSLWVLTRRIAWSDIELVEWRRWARTLALVPRGGERAVSISPMLGGLAPFAALALQQIPVYVLVAPSEGRAALSLMAAGKHAELFVSGKRPTQLTDEIRATEGGCE